MNSILSGRTFLHSGVPKGGNSSLKANNDKVIAIFFSNGYSVYEIIITLMLRFNMINFM